jgi:hypothetical protein
MASMLRITEVLGVKALLYVDPKLVAEVSPSWTKRDEERVRARRSPSLGPATLRRVLPAAAAEMGKRGHLARMRTTTVERRRQIGLAGARARRARRAEVAYLYSRENPDEARQAKVLTADEARRHQHRAAAAAANRMVACLGCSDGE